MNFGKFEVKPIEAPEKSLSEWTVPDKLKAEIPQTPEGRLADIKATLERMQSEIRLDRLGSAYKADLSAAAKYPETIPGKVFDVQAWEKLSPEQTAERREDFDDKRDTLKRSWEEKNGEPWPKYAEDVYSANGKLIRRAGADYDAHHVQPLCLGGRNEVDNITPLHAEVHYDKQGIHAFGSPYDEICKTLGGNCE